ncbi:MAG: phosphoribosylanthranilate isomerase, partial [Verrucomicrobiota bacterium]|nr:phosphoribosylanthranilate isomerase [Verrucomicrobiota bacterium]
ADALGFNLWPGSKRFIELDSATEWLRELPPAVSKVAVLVNSTVPAAEAIFALPFIDLIQLHGSETVETCRALAELDVTFVKAFPLTAELITRDLRDFCTKRILLDSNSARGFGGTGEMINLGLASRFVQAHPGYEVILAGGLTPENVTEGAKRVRPFMVDVASGVELAPGKKDRAAMRDFVAAVRSVAL